MSLTHAILGFLTYSPMTGYDLKTDCFDQSVAHFWPADQAQIYRTLDRLTEEGWVESQVQIQQDRPNRKIYSITEAGRGELRRWLQIDPDLPVHREPFLIQIFFGAQLPNAVLLKLMKNQLEEHRALLEHYNQILLPGEDNRVSQRDLILQGLTLDLGKRLEQTYSEWLRVAMEVVRGLNDRESSVGTSQSE